MTTAQALFLGILQGFTEFLPVSSSGHLVIAETFLNIKIDARTLLSFDVLLHAGTLFALLVVYAKTWWRILTSVLTEDREHRMLLGFLIIATIPAAIVGPFLEDVIAIHLRSLFAVGVALGITGLLLIVAERSPMQRRIAHLSRTNVFLIGVAQACALIPGLSRSGLTISAGRLMRVERREALDFSFLMLAPVTAGASFLTLRHVLMGKVQFPSWQITTVGFFASFVASALAILFLRRWVVSHHLAWFALYLLPMSLFLIVNSW